ncbi:DUF4386 domain-containing protein [Paenibacillus gansuensis]|uniref:DUF4386 domain-containing protein n=1 Tax=Paenibacillus gansuensis TaxID=306542 RepID=A0ABW5P9Y0_9BACL
MQRQWAVTAGLALLIMAAAAFFSYGYAHGILVVDGDPQATFQHLMTSKNLFTGEIFGWFVIVLCDLVAAWGLYEFLKPVNSSLSLLGAWFRLIYTALLALAVMNLLFVQLLLDSSVHPGASEEQVMLYLNAFESMWSMGLILFGVHLAIIGRLTLQSGFIPKWIGVLLLAASAGYISIHLSSLLFAELKGFISLLTYVFTLPMAAGELGLAIWLVFRGGKKD